MPGFRLKWESNSQINDWKKFSADEKTKMFVR